MVIVGRERIAETLLSVDITVLLLDDAMVIHMGIPRLGVAQEHLLDLLESLACGFREAEEDVDSHGRAEDPEQDVHLPLDIHERGRNKV